MVKEDMGTKIKVLFQGLHMTRMLFLYWFVTLKFVFQVPLLTLHFIYKYILTTN
jgi:hypothetical protein